MAAQRLGKRVLSKLQAPSRGPRAGGQPRGVAKTARACHSQVRPAGAAAAAGRGEVDRRALGRAVPRQGETGRGAGTEEVPGILCPWVLWLLVLTVAHAHPGVGHSLDSLVLPSTRRGVLLVDTDTHTRVTRHVLKHLRRTIWGVRRQSWGIGAALSRERGGGDVLKPNIGMVTEEIQLYRDA